MLKSERIKADLGRAIAKRDEWQRKVDDLQDKYIEAQNTEIVGFVRQAQLTPEQLAVVIANARKGILNALPADQDTAGMGAGTGAQQAARDEGSAEQDDLPGRDEYGVEELDTVEDVAYED